MTDENDPVAEIEQAMHWHTHGYADYRHMAETIVERIRTQPALRAALIGAPSSPPSSPVDATEPPAPAPGRADPATAPQEREMRYAEAMCGRDTRMVIAVADAEQAGLKAEVYRLGLFGDVVQDLAADLAKTEVEVERLKADATWDRLAAETGAERAQAEAARLVDRINRQALTITRHQTLYDEAKARALALDADLTDRDGTIERLWRQLNEATNRPDHECSLGWGTDCDGTYCNPGPPDPSGGRGFPEGYGTWLADRDLIAHDPPKRAPEDPLAASKAAILKAMREMEPT